MAGHSKSNEMDEKDLQIIIKEEDWEDSKYRTKEWRDTVETIKWVHDYENKIYVIDYNYKSNNPNQ